MKQPYVTLHAYYIEREERTVPSKTLVAENEYDIHTLVQVLAQEYLFNITGSTDVDREMRAFNGEIEYDLKRGLVVTYVRGGQGPNLGFLDLTGNYSHYIYRNNVVISAYFGSYTDED